MEPVMSIELLDAHERTLSRHRLTMAGATLKIGRSVACDIMLDDAYAAAEHTLLTLQDDGRVAINDLGSRNGTRLNGKLVTADTPNIEDGELIVGRTHLRIRTGHTQLPAERLFRRTLLQRHKTEFAFAGLILVLAYAAFEQWLAAPEQLAPRMLAAMLGVCVALGLWIGIWGLVTRIGHGAWSLRLHVAIAANALALGAWCNWLLGITAFATQWRWLTMLAIAIAIGAAVSGLYLHLRTATHLTVRTATIVAISIPLMLGVAAGWLSQQTTTRDVNRIALGPDIYPPTLRSAASIDLNEHFEHLTALKREANRKRQQSLAEMPIAAIDK